VSEQTKIFFVGLGPGSTDLLTLRAWELLASGKPLIVRSSDHEAVQTVAARGIRFEVVESSDPKSLAKLLIEKSVSSGELVYACPGSAIESPEVMEVVKLAKDSGLEYELVPSVSDSEFALASDPLTLSHGPPQASRAAAAFARLVSVMARLRAPDGCPWDAEQTHSSLAIHLLEEAHETLDAIDRKDMSDLEEELGDLLLQVVFHSEIADEQGSFEVGDVIETLLNKLVHRHPHIFGEVKVSSSRDVLVNWEALKHEQKDRPTLDAGIPKGLPALLLANKVQRRVAGHSGEAPAEGEMIQVAEQLFEPDLDRAFAEELVGELLYLTVAVAQRLGVDPEGALRRHASAALEAASSKTRP
jgi:MazG family protein